MPAFDSAVGDIPWSQVPIPWYQLPNSAAALFGGSGSGMQEEGTLYRLVSGAGIQPGATGADNVLAVFSLPAKAFDGASISAIASGAVSTVASNRGISISAQGAFGATGNNKRVKIFVGCTAAVVGSTVSGGTAIADTGTVATNAGGWSVGADLYKYGAAGSNTQLAVHQQAQCGAAVEALLAPQSLTLTESAPILIAVTGNATTAASDIVLNLMVIQGLN
jgi:hypothetical protein